MVTEISGSESAPLHVRQRSNSSSYSADAVRPLTAERESHQSVDELQWAARGLGVVSVGLSAALVGAPALLRSIAGIRGSDAFLRLVGVREGLAGAGLLVGSNSAPWLWSRVLGDMADLAYLTTNLTRVAGDTRRRALTALAVVSAITTADVIVSVRYSQRRSRRLRGTSPQDVAMASVTVAKTPQECYEFWRNVSNLPRFMPLLQEVRDLGDGRSRWIMPGSKGRPVEWESLLVTDEPGQRIAWRSQKNSQLAHAATVRFEAAPAGRGTVVRLCMQHRSLSGAPRAAARLLRPLASQHLRNDLRRAKQLLETGEVATTDGQSTGRRSLLGRALQRWSLT